MTRIRQSEYMPGSLKVQADMWHRSRGDGRVRVARTYRLHKTRDGSGAEEFVLTRYEGRVPDKGRVAMSSLLKVEGEGYELTFTEVFSCLRKQEGAEIVKWYARNGAIMEKDNG